MANNSVEGWATRFGLVMAMAGNAVGLGNFLRFPGQAAPYGGAFMIPYFLALLLLGIPLMWIEWTIGRHGGGFGHGSTPGMFHRLWSHPISKYVGILGVLLPMMVGVYYIYIASWTVGYAYMSLTGEYWGKTDIDSMKQVFQNYLDVADSHQFIAFPLEAYVFFLITFALNIYILYRGVSAGIEKLALYAMPLLFVLGIILAVRVLTLPPVGDRTISDGLAQIWRVTDWSKLSDSQMWIKATGQIFFTLSVGLGMVHSYASYLKKHQDITLNGLATAATNEFVEVVLGGTIAIPAAVLFFGVTAAQAIVEQGSFAIGFYALPVIFQQMPAGQLWAVLWFFLLFLAALTSSVAMFMPMVLFLTDELQVPRARAVLGTAIVALIFSHFIVFFMHHGVLDEVDYWMGTFGLVVFVALEAVIFCWIFGMERGWIEMHEGAELQIPKIFFYIMKYVTPLYALVLLGWFAYDGLWPTLIMADKNPADIPYLWIARGLMLAVMAFLIWGVWYAWRTHPKFFDEVETEE